MEATTVTHLWMGGVIAVMLVYAVFATLGLMKRKPHKKAE